VLKRRLYKVPHALYTVVLHEMQEYGLIEKTGGRNNMVFKYKGGEIDKKLNQYYTIFN